MISHVFLLISEREISRPNRLGGLGLAARRNISTRFSANIMKTPYLPFSLNLFLPQSSRINHPDYITRSSNIVRVIKFRRLRQAGHVARTEEGRKALSKLVLERDLSQVSPTRGPEA